MFGLWFYETRNSSFLLNNSPIKQLKQKEKALARYRDSLSVMEPDSLEAQHEVLELFTAFLPSHYPDKYTYDAASHCITVHATKQTHCLKDWKTRPLELCARIVQEDLVLMREAPDDSFRMAAGTVVFSFNDLPKKLGTTTNFIHAPVPGYAKHLSKVVYLSFKNLKPEKPMWRNNWFILSSGGRLDEDDGNKPNVRDRFIKVEYQTIRKLPKTGYLLFTIRNFTDPLSSLEHVPATAAETLAASIRGMSSTLLKYKGIESDQVRDDMLAYLDSISVRKSKHGVKAMPQWCPWDYLYMVNIFEVTVLLLSSWRWTKNVKVAAR